MAALVSRIMPYVTVTKVGKEMADKSGPSCVFLSHQERKPLSGSLQQNSPQISLARSRSCAYY